MPLHSAALIDKTASIFTDEEKREQSPAAEIRQPPDWPRDQEEGLPIEDRNMSLPEPTQPACNFQGALRGKGEHCYRAPSHGCIVSNTEASCPPVPKRRYFRIAGK